MRVAALLVPLLLASAAPAAEHAQAPRSADTIPVDEVLPGMRGHGESVFVGTTAERFEVEVLGVLRDVQPGTSYILARLSGRDLERTGVVAGMSGSPVWLDGRLAGAVAFAWPFSQEAIAGVTPIAAMRGIPHAAPWGGAAGAPRVAFGDLLRGELPEDLLTRAASALLPAAGLGGRPPLLWGASGFHERTLERLTQALPALAPTAAGTRADMDFELAAGSSIAALYIDGDFRLAATGTVTEREGERILAFGHPVTGLSEIELPMAAAEVITILGSDFSSFKLSNSGAVVGTFERDHAAGTLGRLGRTPRMVPLAVTVATPEPRAFRMSLARVPDFLPVLAAIGTFASLDVATAAGGVAAVDLELAVDLGERGTTRLRQSYDGPNSGLRAIVFVLAIVDFLARNELAEVEIHGIEARLTPYGESRAARVVGSHAAPLRVRAGERTEIVVELRNFRGEVERQRIPVTVPAELPRGRYALIVGDGVSLDGVRFALEPADPRSFEQARNLVESLGSTRQLGYLGLAPGSGVTAGGGALPQLPPSVRSLWAAAQPAARPLRTAIVARERIDVARPVSGLARIDLEVVRAEPAAGENGSETPAARAPRRPPAQGGGGAGR
jgi:hypothetical protein